LFSFQCCAAHRDLHSFPTRRSSDLAFDARDAFAPQLRGSGRYARELLGALQRGGDVELDVLRDGGRAPELWWEQVTLPPAQRPRDRKSTRLNSSHVEISYAVFCLKK